MASKSERGKGKRADNRLIEWRSGRAYGDFRAYADVGGAKVALAEAGKTWATNDEAIAALLYDAELERLDLARRGKVGVRVERNTTLAELVQHHLVMKATAAKTSDSHMFDLESRLAEAIRHFGAGRDPRSIEPADVRTWAHELARGGRRKPGTVRHYLNALSGLYRRAQEGIYVDPGYNPVAALVEKPSGTATREEAKFFEVHQAALILEAARALDARTNRADGSPFAAGNRIGATPGLHVILATLMLTGGRWSEVRGLDVDDVSFDRNLVRFRPNAHRGLKTKTSRRDVPLWPQLREILQRWIYDRPTPLTSGLLFPSDAGGMVKDPRKSLDAIAKLCGMEQGEIRTRAFRHTYCAARLQCVERILRPGADPGAWDFVEVTRDRVAREMGHGGTGLVARIYGHAPRLPYRSEVVEYRVERHRAELGERLTALVTRV